MIESTVVTIDNLHVFYGRSCAVAGLSFAIPKGRSLGLLGVNGAGKTSTLRCLLGMKQPRQGSVRVFGCVPGHPEVLRRVGYAPEEALPPEYLTGGEYLSIVGSMRCHGPARGRDEIEQLLSWIELDPRKTVRDYSKGMRRRLLIAQAFIGSPDLLILDEPLNGLDPVIIIRLREKLAAYCADGGTLLYSSHILAEVEKTCTDIAILHAGRLAWSGTVGEAVAGFGSVESAFAAKVGGGGTA